MRRLIASLLLFAACGLPAARAEDGAARLERARRIWNAQSPEQRARLLENFQRFQALPRERRAELRERLKTFQELTPEKKSAIEASWQRFERLPEAKRVEIRRALVPRRPEAVRAAPKSVGPTSKPARVESKSVGSAKPVTVAPKPEAPAKNAAPSVPPASDKTKALSPLERKKADHERRRAERNTRIRK
jgi:hypothetical protein